MPPRGQRARVRLLATVRGLRHERLCAGRLGEVLEACSEETGGDPIAAALVARARQEVDRAVRVPPDLARALAAATGEGHITWARAREEDDASIFLPVLETILRLRCEEAEAIGSGGTLYDAMLTAYEPGVTEASLAALFSGLERGLRRILAAVDGPVDQSVMAGRFPAAGQAELARRTLGTIGFDLRAGRLDPSIHPFCAGLAPGDVRLTWRWQEDDLRPGILGVLHEGGHGLYEQGLPAEWEGWPIGAAASTGLHESQSRFWENHVGRSRGFWRWIRSQSAELFPDWRPDEEAVLAALGAVRPSLVRVEADETTYGLHVVLRFDLERRLVAGSLAVEDLPEAWDEGMQRLLGVRPESPLDGVLQDIHWAEGLFGYFPTYTLGSMAAAQLWETCERELGDLEEAMALGELAPLREWCRDRIHRHGASRTAGELIEGVTGRALEPGPLLRHLEKAVLQTAAPGG